MSVFQATDIRGFFNCLSRVSQVSGLPKNDIHAAIVSARVGEQKKRQADLPTWAVVEFKVQPGHLFVDFQSLEAIAGHISFEFTVKDGALALN